MVTVTCSSAICGSLGVVARVERSSGSILVFIQHRDRTRRDNHPHQRAWTITLTNAPAPGTPLRPWIYCDQTRRIPEFMRALHNGAQQTARTFH